MLKQEFRLFLDSFKVKKNFFYIIGYDLMFYIIATVFVSIFGGILTKISSTVDLNLINKALLDPTPAQMKVIETTVNNAKVLVYLLVASIFLYLLIILFSWSLSRGLIYANLLKKKFNSKFYWRFLLLNLVYFVPLILISLAFIYVIKEIPQAFYVFILVLLVMFYFLTLSYIFFIKGNKVFKATGNAIEFGFTKLHKLAIPLLLIIVVFIVISFISSLINRILGFGIQPFVSLIVFLIFMAWARIYFVKVVSKV